MQRRLMRALVAAALTGAAVAGSAGWVTGSAQPAVTGPPPGAAAWRADRSLGRPLPDPATSPPARVAAFFAGLAPGERRSLVRRHPLTVGNLDGAPVALRYAANERALRTELRRARKRAADPSRTLQDHERARERAYRYALLLDGGRQILAFDPRGRGQLAEVYGDLAAARHVAVFVPGSDVDLASFAPGTPRTSRAAGPAKTRQRRPAEGTPRAMAEALRAQMTRAAPGVRTAAVAWAGYSTPVGLGPDAATARLARAGAPRLLRLLRGLAVAGAPAPAVFCHSYGSVVCGLAAPHLTSRDAADLVVFGSPGMRAGSVADLRTPVRVWAARSPSDWIRRVPHVRVFDLGHGADPVSPAFGARVVSAERADGHAGYLAPGSDSRANFAAVALGRYGGVRCAPRSRACARTPRTAAPVPRTAPPARVHGAPPEGTTQPAPAAARPT